MSAAAYEASLDALDGSDLIAEGLQLFKRSSLELMDTKETKIALALGSRFRRRNNLMARAHKMWKLFGEK